MPASKLITLARDAADHFGISPALVCAIVEQESSWDPWATRFEPRYRWLYPFGGIIKSPCRTSNEMEIECQKTSWGLMQVMGAVAREYGYPDYLWLLLHPEVGLSWGCRHFAAQLDRYDDDIEKAVSAYNAGHATSKNYDTYTSRVLARMEHYR